LGPCAGDTYYRVYFIYDTLPSNQHKERREKRSEEKKIHDINAMLLHRPF